MTGTRLDELDLCQMVPRNTSSLGTAFTVSIDAVGFGVTTGISAYDRSQTIRVAIDSSTQPHDLARPGHVFPLRARWGGILERPGHTEAAVDLAQLAGLHPSGVICEIMNQDGSMARLPDLARFCARHDLRMITIEDLVTYRLHGNVENVGLGFADLNSLSYTVEV
jgi:3,4-dihydroxy-2-butanone 4-phosphate synthase